jgi:hypothetical protein
MKYRTAHGILLPNLIVGLWAALLLALLHLAQAGCQVLSGGRMSRWDQASQAQHRGFDRRSFTFFSHPSVAAFSINAPRLSSRFLEEISNNYFLCRRRPARVHTVPRCYSCICCVIVVLLTLQLRLSSFPFMPASSSSTPAPSKLISLLPHLQLSHDNPH